MKNGKIKERGRQIGKAQARLALLSACTAILRLDGQSARGSDCCRPGEGCEGSL